MTKSLERFKQARATRGNGPYPAEARAVALDYAEEELSRGRTVTSIAGDLGVDGLTLRTWLKCAVRPKRSGKLCEVIVTDPPQAAPTVTGDLTVTTAQGHVVSGLDLESATSLLRALA